MPTSFVYFRLYQTEIEHQKMFLKNKTWYVVKFVSEIEGHSYETIKYQLFFRTCCFS